jgi:hypothetical protein
VLRDLLETKPMLFNYKDKSGAADDGIDIAVISNEFRRDFETGPGRKTRLLQHLWQENLLSESFPPWIRPRFS